jgi:hypothetical protein
MLLPDSIGRILYFFIDAFHPLKIYSFIIYYLKMGAMAHRPILAYNDILRFYHKRGILVNRNVA